jgi:flagellar hook-associated protein 1 FlgK
VAILGAAFQIGRSALAAYQAAIAITGQNIANVGNPNYTRQSGRLAAVPGGMTAAGVAPGAGVDLTGIQRHVDEAVQARLRLAYGSRSGAETTYNTLNRVESLYNELTDGDLSSQLNAFFGSFTSLQTDPADTSARELALSSADTVIHTLQRQRSSLLDQITDLNNSVEQIVPSANEMLSEVARLNELIVTQATRGGGDSALRDRRDALLSSLSELMDIQTREQSNGVVNIYLGSEPLVDGSRSRGLTTQRVIKDGIERVTVRFADNNGSVVLRDGRLAAIVDSRDTDLTGQLGKLDQLTRGLIWEVNRVHASGRGLTGYTTLTGTYAANSRTAALNTAPAGLPFQVQNGTFLVHVRDRQSGQEVTRMIQVDLDGLGGNDTTLNSLATDLDALPHVSATITADNRLKLDADPGYDISFSEDSSNALASLGLATFFEGTDAATLAVRPAVRDNPQLIATSLSGAPGDGDNAGRLAAVGSAASALLNDQSIVGFHGALVSKLGVDVAAARSNQEATDAVYSSLLAQRESISGVSLDEEAINLTKYERSFQGVSRFLSVVDSLTTEIMNLVRVA